MTHYTSTDALPDFAHYDLSPEELEAALEAEAEARSEFYAELEAGYNAEQYHEAEFCDDCPF